MFGKPELKKCSGKGGCRFLEVLYVVCVGSGNSVGEFIIKLVQKLL